MVAIALLHGSVVGLSLGLTGGGGSIFAVPLLVYGLDLSFRQAVTLSLGTVGSTATLGAALQRRGVYVLWLHGALIGCGGIMGVPIGTLLGSLLSQEHSLTLFGLLMLFIATWMLFPHYGPRTPRWMKCAPQSSTTRLPTPCIIRLLVAGFLTGILSGLLGVGGGFLLIPAILTVTHATIQQAMATSLVAIAIISVTGFLQNLSSLKSLSPLVPTLFLIGSAIGMFAGVSIKKRCSARLLQIIFGLAIIVCGIFVLSRAVFS